MEKLPTFRKFYKSTQPIKEARGFTIKELRSKAFDLLSGLGIKTPTEEQMMMAIMSIKSMIKDNNLGKVFESDKEVLEGAMSEIHMMAKKAKTFDQFKKMFMEEFGDKLEGAEDLDSWLEELYNDMK